MVIVILILEIRLNADQWKWSGRATSKEFNINAEIEFKPVDLIASEVNNSDAKFIQNFYFNNA